MEKRAGRQREETACLRGCELKRVKEDKKVEDEKKNTN